MGHITAPDVGSRDETVQAQYEAYRDEHSHFAALRAVLVRFPSALIAVDEMYARIMNEGRLGRLLREWLFVASSVVRGCEYAVAGHGRWLAGPGGMDPEHVAALQRGEDPATASEPERVLLGVCRKVAAAAHRTVDADVARLEEAGWDRHAMVEAFSVVALSGWMNGVAGGLGLEPDTSETPG